MMAPPFVWFIVIRLAGEDVHDIAALLKSFFAELPEPVMTHAAFEPLVDAGSEG